MAIYKLGDVVGFIRGNSSFQKKDLLSKGKYIALHYGKTYKIDEVNDKYNFFVNDEFYKEKYVIKKNDTIMITTSETRNELGKVFFYNVDNEGLLGGEQILLFPKNKLILKKYIFYWFKKNSKLFRRFSTGISVFRIKGDDLNFLNIDLPSLTEQQKIIDIIERDEELFLKFSYCVQIDSLEKTKGDMQNLIDIIEPLQKMIDNINNFVNTVNTLIKNLPSIEVCQGSDFLTPLRNKKKNISQISAKVMLKRNPLITSIENKNTYKTNTFFVSEGTILINTIRTYLEKFSIVHCDSDANGTLAQFKVENNDFSSVFSTLLNDNFWIQSGKLSKGTKMPVINKKDILENIEFKRTKKIRFLSDFYVFSAKLIHELEKNKGLYISLLIK